MSDDSARAHAEQVATLLGLDCSEYTSRLYQSVLLLDDITDRELAGWDCRANPVGRLAAVEKLLSWAFRWERGRVDGQTFEPPGFLWHGAELDNEAHREVFGTDAPGWEEWLTWWDRYEKALSFRVLDLVAGRPSSLRECFEMWGPYVVPLWSSEAVRRSSFVPRDRWKGCDSS